VKAIFFLAFVACQLWVICAVARAVLSWFPITYDSPAHRINSFLVRVTEPLIAPVRRVLPPVRAGNVGLDLAFLVVILVLEFLVIPFLGRHAF
jgi:YggT family protein